MSEVVCFHNLGEENDYLSNWFLSEFKVDDVTFSSMEQYMMYQKAIIFGDTDIATKIMNENDPSIIKEYGRRIVNYNDTVWNGIRQIIVYKGLLAKFSQNEILKKRLKSTKSAILAECAVNDRIWGIGISMKNEDRYDISKWKGKNLLGFTLMQVRNDI